MLLTTGGGRGQRVANSKAAMLNQNKAGLSKATVSMQSQGFRGTEGKDEEPPSCWGPVLPPAAPSLTWEELPASPAPYARQYRHPQNYSCRCLIPQLLAANPVKR